MSANKNEPRFKRFNCFCGVFIQQLVKILSLITRKYRRISFQFGDTIYCVIFYVRVFLHVRKGTRGGIVQSHCPVFVSDIEDHLL